MARGRMINRTLAKSGKFNNLNTDFSRLLYCMMLPFTDRDGRLDGDPCAIRSDCFPKRRDVTIEKIQKSLEDLHNSGLIYLYVVNGEQFIEIDQFIDNQSGMKYDRETPTNIPDPDQCRSNAGSNPDMVPRKRREEKRREEKGLDFSFIDKEDWIALFKEWAENKKSPYKKQVGLQKGYAELHNMAKGDISTARKIVDKSLANNWAGIFPLKDSTESTQKTSPLIQKEEYHKRPTSRGRCLTCGKHSDLVFGKCEECQS